MVEVTRSLPSIRNASSGLYFWSPASLCWSRASSGPTRLASRRRSFLRGRSAIRRCGRSWAGSCWSWWAVGCRVGCWGAGS